MRSPIHDLSDEGRQIQLAFSPCPNDTFMMDALVHHRISHPYHLSTHLLDIQQLNESAINAQYDVSKISAATLPLIENTYQLLESGAAMGFGVGPILVSKYKLSAEKLTNCTIGIPGQNTTAHYLFRHFFPEANHKKYMLFSEIESAILDGRLDAGVLIHEGRFTYQSKGLQLIYDLGALWESTYQLPIPLGILVAKKSLGQSSIAIIDRMISESIQYAFDHPDASGDYVLQHSQEMSPEVTRQHIQLYVNKYSVHMGTNGHQALDFLLGKIPSETSKQLKAHPHVD